MTIHVIFDLDGTLADTEFETSVITADLAREKGWEISAEDVFVHHAGLGAKEKFASIAKAVGATATDEELAQLGEEHERRKKLIYDREHLPLMQHAAEMLAGLAKTGALISLASTNPSYRSKSVLDRAGLRKFFDDRVFGPDLVEWKKKPDPAVYLAAMAASGVDAKNTFVVEDTLPGIVAGHAAGTFVIALLDPRFGNGKEAEDKMKAFIDDGANAIIRSLDGVLQIVPVSQKPAAAVSTAAPKP